MSEEIIVALIGMLGAVVVAIPTIIINRSNNIKHMALIDYKIEQLKREVEKHNQVVERVFKLEKRADVYEEKISVANHRIEDLEKGD